MERTSRLVSQKAYGYRSAKKRSAHRTLTLNAFRVNRVLCSGVVAPHTKNQRAPHVAPTGFVTVPSVGPQRTDYARLIPANTGTTNTKKLLPPAKGCANI